MYPIIEIGPLAIRTPGLILILGIWIGLSLAERLSKNSVINPNAIYNLVFTALISGIIGARVMYAVRHLDVFVDAPLSLLSLNPGFLDPSSGYAFGFIASIIYGNRRGIPFWPTLDALTPMFAVITIAYWLSQFASGDSFGIETQLPWGVQLWGANRHPTQIYYTINAVVNLGIIWSIVKQRKHATCWDGKVFLTFLVLSSTMYLFWDAFRDDSKILLDGVRRTQVAAWFVLISSLIGINILTKARNS